MLVVLIVATLAATAAASLGRTLLQDASGAAGALRARTAADGALTTVLANWPSTWTTVLIPGGSDTRTITSPAGSATVRALRLDVRRYLLTADATSAAVAGPVGPAVRRTGVFAQLDNVAYDVPAVVVAAGPVSLATDTDVRAADAPPPTWSDCVTTPDVPPAAVAAPSATLATGARVAGSVVTAPATWTPPVPERFGDVDRATLAARADVILTAGGTFTPVPRAAPAPDPACARDAASWGEPLRGPGAVTNCTTDYPVIHIRGPGSSTIRGPARLQGTLLVDGSLDVVGRVEVAGLVVVGGTVQSSTGSLVVDGALLARGNGAALGTGSRVRRSRCALERAAAAASRPVPLARRAWVDVVR
ncbi:hypothetical protein tb265_05470 [Gemmatimonadetes bacterium T265]|nr:hypothetical protein tb265_05470 [Gemmatimonadetes bacterium T265]